MEPPVNKFLTKIVEISREYGAPQPKLKLKVPLASIKESLAKKEKSIEPEEKIPLDISDQAVKTTKLQFKAPRAQTPVRAPSPAVTRKPHLEKCFKYLRKLMTQRNAHWFLFPVDPVALNIPTYLEIIKNPMDFSTIQKKIDDELYQDEGEFADDVRLVFTNSMTFNPSVSQPHIDAQILLQKFEKEFLGIKNAAPKFEASAGTFKDIAQRILDKLAKSKNSAIFRFPVDRTMYPDYYQVITQPIDMITIGNKISTGAYSSLSDFHGDVQLMFDNCFKYNRKGTYGYNCGVDLQHFYSKLMKPHLKQLKSEQVYHN
jgi:transcription initiation factor TFIID subunit 2